MSGFILAAAMVLDACMGEPPWLWSRIAHPAVLMGRIISRLETRLNKGTHRLLKGGCALIILLLIVGGIGWAISLLGPVFEMLGAAILLAQRSLVQHVRAVATGLRGSLEHGRAAAAMIVGRDLRDAQRPDVARAAIESAAENFADGVIAPAFWFCIGGLPGIAIYKAVNTADSMIGHRTPRYAVFGKPAARLDDLLNLIPARLAAFLISAFGWRTVRFCDMQRDARQHRSPNAGWPESAMARVLGVALSGPRSYDGVRQDLPWVHETGAHDIGPEQIDAAARVLWRAWGLALVAVLLALLMRL